MSIWVIERRYIENENMDWSPTCRAYPVEDACSKSVNNLKDANRDWDYRAVEYVRMEAK